MEILKHIVYAEYACLYPFKKENFKLERKRVQFKHNKSFTTFVLFNNIQLQSLFIFFHFIFYLLYFVNEGNWNKERKETIPIHTFPLILLQRFTVYKWILQHFKTNIVFLCCVRCWFRVVARRVFHKLSAMEFKTFWWFCEAYGFTLYVDLNYVESLVFFFFVLFRIAS